VANVRKSYPQANKSYPQVIHRLVNATQSYPQLIHRRNRTCVRRGGGGGRTSVRVAGRLKDSYKFLKLGSLFSNVQRYPTSSNVLLGIPNVLQSNPPSIKRPPTYSKAILRSPTSAKVSQYESACKVLETKCRTLKTPSNTPIQVLLRLPTLSQVSMLQLKFKVRQ